MTCASCGRANRTGARFCGGCGAALAPRCPACGVESEAGAQFCDACGASLVERSADDGVARKVVTIVFADLIGSMSLQEGLDPESDSRLMEAYHRAVSVPVEAEGGTVVQLLGDGVMCAFGVPRGAEDDAIRAVRAAVGMQRAFRDFLGEHRELAGRIGLRVAVNTGEVVVSDDYAAGIGDPLNVAARLQQEAHDGDVLIGEATQRLVAERVTLEPIGVFALKGRAEGVAAYRVVSLDRPAGAAAAPFVGRDEELRRITSLYDATVAARGARLAVLLGSPGLGKSRLIAELTRRLGDMATVLCAHCDAAGGATFAPLAEALRAQLHLDAASSGDALRAAIDAVVPGDEAERARVAAGIGALLAGTPALPEETFFVVRRLLAALASERPLVLAIDDVQWAEPLLLDLIEHLVQWGAGVPLLLLAAARPELRDTRSSLTVPGGLVSDVLTLAGLDAGAATRLAASVIGADALPAAVAGRVLATSEGNPLFLGELVRMLVNDGALKREGDRWTAGVELAGLEMPPTIQALLAARIERLRPDERLVLERAAVVGRQFSRAAVAHLLPREAQADLDVRLESLRRSELIEPDTGWLLGEPVLRFHHMLIRDAAYRRLLRNTRADLHGRFADWLESRVGASVEHDEAIGWHLEQAHEHLRELGPLNERGRAFGERSARYLAAAGRRALARDDLRPAASLLGRALDRLDAEDPARADLALDWCEALLAAGDVGPAMNAIAELGRFAGASARHQGWHTCFTGQLAVLTDPQALRASADAVAAAADSLAAAGDAAGEAKAHSVHANALARLGRIGASESALDRALAAARRARDRRRANAVLAGAPLAALWGPSAVTRASGRCLDVVRVLRITQGAPAVEAVALRCQAVLETLRGRAEAARRMIASSRRMVEELGITQRLLEADVFAGLIELLEGDAVAAERFLRTAYEGLREHGLGIDAAQAAALLGRALLAQGRAAEAEVLSHESEALAGDDLKAAIAWRGVRAEALARRGEHAAAIALARAAVEVAAATDDLLDHADARRALAVVLQAAGQSDEAESEEERAIELWETKGATLLADRARRDLGRAEQAHRLPVEQEKVVPIARRRVPANAATANAARMDAAVAARDLDAFLALLAEGAKSVHHPTGVTYEERESLEAYKALLRAEDLTFTHEPIATLGDSLALCRGSLSFGVAEDHAERFGATINDTINLIEVDAHGLRARTEFFAVDRLGDAVARLYERYADLVSEGLDRDRAAATARSVATFMGAQLELDALREAFHPDVEYLDHRAVGFPSGRGVESLLLGFQSLFDVVDHFERRVDDVLALATHGVLVRLTTSGIARSGGGAYEHHSAQLWIFGPDGRVTRMEFFEGERGDEAIARFHELNEGPLAARAERASARGMGKPAQRERPNAATAYVARLDAVVAARDAGALPSLFTEDLQVVHHPTATEFGREGALSRFRALIQAEDLRHGHEPLATLGDSLALCHATTSMTALGEDDIAPAGPIQSDRLVVIEVDAGRQRRAELFAEDRLGNAIARLYALFAESLPEGPEQARASATAYSVAAVLGLAGDDAAFRRVLSSNLEFVDHQQLGVGRAHGPDLVRRGNLVLHEVADDVTNRVDELLALRSDGLVACRTMRGTDRVGGGTFERQHIELWAFGSDGLLVHLEHFDCANASDALARFDALAAGPSAVRPSQPSAQALARHARRVRPNAATENAARLDAAFAAHDAEIFPGLLADRTEVVHHPTGTVHDREGVLASWRSLLEAADVAYANEPLATLGEAIALCRRTSRSSGGLGFEDSMPFGAAENENLFLIEVGEGGRRQRAEVFAPDRLADALIRFYGFYAETLPEGPDRERAAATARGVAALLGPRVDDVLALRFNALLVRWTTLGTPRAGGGSYEYPFLQLWVFGPDGLVTHNEQFGPDREAEALARFDELRAPASASFGNATSRAQVEFERCWQERRWEDAIATYASAVQLDDRRALVGLNLVGDEFLTNLRMLFEIPESRWHTELIATRGERLALFRARFSGGAAEGGQIVAEHLTLNERDAQNRTTTLVVFDLDQMNAAYAELDLRYAAGEGAPHATLLASMDEFRRAAAIGDRNALARLLPDHFTMESHRRFGSTGTRLSRDEYIASMGVVEGLAVQGILRLDHLRTSATAAIGDSTWYGTRDGGDFELPVVFVFEHEGGRFRAWELFDREQLGAAFARYEELMAGATQVARIENAATRSRDRFIEAWNRRQWERIASGFSAGFRQIDRRGMGQLDLDLEQHLASLRLIFEKTSSRFTAKVIATRGERLALTRSRFEATTRSAGPSEAETLSLVELDDRGDRNVVVMFDPENLDAAYAELDARYAAGEAADLGRVAAAMSAFNRAFADRDWDALAAQCAPDIIVNDHRLLGWETLHGAAAYLAAVRSLVDLAPDARLRLDHVTRSEHGYLVITVWAGTREGGAFEAPSLMVCELDEHARVRRFDQYDLDRFDEARSRFEVLGAGAPSDPELRPDPLLIPPNSATGIFDRWREAFEARDWQALERLCAPALVYEDRRRMDLISGDRDVFLASSRLLAEMAPPRITRTVLATAGDRLALEHLLWSSDDLEGEVLQVVEVDAEGRFLALIGFDPHDLRAASIELRERYFCGDEGKVLPVSLIELARALDHHDLVRMRAALDPEFVFHDHRRTGVGRIDDVDQYVALMAATFEQTPDGRSEDLYRVATERHGGLSVGHTVGTLASGGAFESIYVRIQWFRNGRHVGTELFEPEDLEIARARFEALRPDPLRIPPNAATRAMDRWTERAEARDFEALQSLFSPGLIWEDRRKLFRDSGDRDRLLASIHVAVSSGARATRTTIATAGDRLELAQVRFCLFDGATLISEIEILLVAEVDAEGRVVAAITFDPDDRSAASLEMFDRYVRGEGARFTPPSTIAFLRAMNAHDIAGVRAALLDDFYFHDHRRTGVGRIEGADEYVASLSPMREMSPDMASDTLYHIAVEEHGSLNVGRMFGTLADGGEFESIFARIVWYENGRNVGTELFELEDLDRVRSLFEQRRPGPLRIPPNAATRAMDRLGRARGARDWDAMLQMCSPAMVFEDRSRGALLVGGRDMFIASSRVVTSYEARVSQTLLATAGDRLALRRLQFAGTTGGGAAEAEALSLVEVDAEGRIAAIVAFDPGDRRAASVELCDRYFRSDEMRAIPAGFAAGMRAMNARDLEALRAALPDDFLLHDHRRTGLGRVEGAPPFIQSLAVLFDQAPDMVVETLYTVGTNEHGVLEMAHMFGKLAASGGEFEAVYLRLGMYQGDRIVGMELFEPEDLEVARARFEALRPRD